MTAPDDPSRDGDDLALARHGDRAAFDRLVAPHVARLRVVVFRLVGDPEEAADLVQDTLVRAYTHLGTFRGDAKLSTWLHTVAVRLALDHLRGRRVAGDAKLALKDHVHAHHGGALRQRFDEDTFDAREHVAFCFGCVARSLPVDEQAALVLRDVLELSNDEAAKTLGVSTSVLRHRLAAARTTMITRYEGLCRLVSKEGVCYQCEGLRQSFPERRQGPPVPAIAAADPAEAWANRMAAVRAAPAEGGASSRFHAFLWRTLAELTGRPRSA